jgi:mono/diheme cytochrome c family protein
LHLFPYLRLVVCYGTVAVFFCVGGAADQGRSENETTFSEFRPRREIPGVEFVGSAVCAACHGQEGSSHSQTSMAHALHIASESSVLRSHPRMTFQSGPYAYEIASDGRQVLYRVTDGEESIREPILYAFGNAHIAQTYIFRHDGKLYEGRVSYYKTIDRLDWTIGDVQNPTPSLEEAAGRDISGDEARNCFSCHGTAATVGNKLRLENLIAGVGCEACHGPGAEHVAAMKAGAGENLYIFNPRKLGAEALSQEFCGACHRGVDAVAMMPNLGGINNVRFQPYRLFNSRGHDPNDPRLTCTSCHDPHVELKQEDSSYDSRCTACHGLRTGRSTSLGKTGAAAASKNRVRHESVPSR